jgi:hypothetical protein
MRGKVNPCVKWTLKALGYSMAIAAMTGVGYEVGQQAGEGTENAQRAINTGAIAGALITVSLILFYEMGLFNCTPAASEATGENQIALLDEVAQDTPDSPSHATSVGPFMMTERMVNGRLPPKGVTEHDLTATDTYRDDMSIGSSGRVHI